jgi:hypothetical protein
MFKLFKGNPIEFTDELLLEKANTMIGQKAMVNGFCGDIEPVVLTGVIDIINNSRDRLVKFSTSDSFYTTVIFDKKSIINWKYNILAKNINETEKERINPLSVKDILDILRYSNNNLTRFKKEFYSLTYNQYQVFGTFQTKAEYKTSTIYLNPLVAYRGNDIEELRTLINMFEIQPIQK